MSLILINYDFNIFNFIIIYTLIILLDIFFENISYHFIVYFQNIVNLAFKNNQNPPKR